MIDAAKMTEDLYTEDLYSARTMLSGQNVPTAVSVINVSSRPQKLSDGTFVGQAAMVSTVETESTLRGRQHNEIVPVHLQSMIDQLPSDLSTVERQEAINFVKKYAVAFSKSEFDIGRTRLIPHIIDTGNNRPMRQQLRRHPRAHLQFIDDEVQKMLDNDIVEASASPWSSNVVLVAKKWEAQILCRLSKFERIHV